MNFGAIAFASALVAIGLLVVLVVEGLQRSSDFRDRKQWRADQGSGRGRKKFFWLFERLLFLAIAVFLISIFLGIVYE
jgi:ABC-type Fe3+ transport system permease subunit